MKKYFIVTYGCQMNVHESEKLAGALESLGFSCAEKMEEADVIVFNTCAIREGAETKAFGNIGALKHLKKENPNLIIAVGGCMAEQPHAHKKLTDKFPFVDIVFGTNNLFRFKELLNKRLETKKRVKEIGYQDVVPENEQIHRTSGDNAYVNIIYGCNNFCTYCIVPYVRGRERSRSESSIINEVKGLVKEGYKTITLLGQNVNSYGKDLKKKSSFASLLTKICKIKGDFEVKFMTSHPKDFSDELINVIATEPKMAKEIHLPVQAGSNKTLKAMNRVYTREHYLGLVKKIRKQIPSARLSTDIIVGFPGETKRDFNATISLIKKVKYDSIFAYMYSKRHGTVAEKLPNQVDIKEKHRRVNKVLNLERKIQRKKRKN